MLVLPQVRQPAPQNSIRRQAFEGAGEFDLGVENANVWPWSFCMRRSMVSGDMSRPPGKGPASNTNRRDRCCK